ncbi:hypothetical protein T440DRAFT_67716 [Plenodomus tracheiphilus IPT5]|uniref:Uncharacterized protein n=1 Tax=Plenodomus tracheiphilus IPT5 TaxID=1408161 RepID=A0A6A7APJ0_9PLEO|nr:hypothetical protein T440DRAFT_67716 [Plenodomus tracheiphilus IPT5]
MSWEYYLTISRLLGCQSCQSRHSFISGEPSLLLSPGCVVVCQRVIKSLVLCKARAASTLPRVLRSSTITEEDVRQGQALQDRIYQRLGNPDLFALMDNDFEDLCKSSIFDLEDYGQGSL